MGLMIFFILAVMEIGLAIWTCTKGKESRGFRKQRLIVRTAQVAIVVGAMLLPFGQKWRFAPLLGFLVVLLIIALLIMLLSRDRKDGIRKPLRSVVSCVLCILVFGMLLVPAFLFTGYKGLPVSGKYRIGESSAILIDRSRTDPFEQDGSFREVPVHFYYPQILPDGTSKDEKQSDGASSDERQSDGMPTYEKQSDGKTSDEKQSDETSSVEKRSDEEQRFPLVIFSHGAFGYYQSNTSTYMELASNGYVVVSMDHPHHAFFTKDTDGRIVMVDKDFLNTAMHLSEKDDLQECYSIYTEWMALRTADMNFVLDQLKAAGESGALNGDWFLNDNDSELIPSVLRMTDFSRTGLMGHSMGGATAVELGRERNDVSAVVDIDGTMLGEYLGVENGDYLFNEEPYAVPVLEFNNWESYTDLKDYLEQGGIYPNDKLISNAATGFTTTIHGTKHMDYTDLPLLSPILGKMLGSGERSTEETMTIVNSLVLSFFNSYLKGEGVFTVQEIY